MAKTWHQKFETSKQPLIETSVKTWGGIPAGEKFLISTPKDIDSYIRTIPAGKSVSFQTMKKDMALDQGVEFMCPLTAGIFTRIVSELAYESYKNGADLKSVTPFWRVVDLKMPLSKKLSFGSDFIREQRKIEGIDA